MSIWQNYKAFMEKRHKFLSYSYNMLLEGMLYGPLAVEDMFSFTHTQTKQLNE